MYHRADGTVDVKLLADLGYIADRLRNLEQKWDLTELKDLHRRIVLKFDDPPASVLRQHSALALTPAAPSPAPPVPTGSPQPDEQGEGHGSAVVIVTTAASESPSAVYCDARATTPRDDEARSGGSSSQHTLDDVSDLDEGARKLDQLEDLLIAFYRNCGRAERSEDPYTDVRFASGSNALTPAQHAAPSGPKTTKKKEPTKQQPTPNGGDGDNRATTTAEHGQQRQPVPCPPRTMSESATDHCQQDTLPSAAPAAATGQPALGGSSQQQQQQQQQAQHSQPLRSIYDGDAESGDLVGVVAGPATERGEPLVSTDDDDDTVTVTTETSSECCSQQTVVVVGDDEPGTHRQELSRPASQSVTDRAAGGGAAPGNDTTGTSDDEEEDSEDGTGRTAGDGDYRGYPAADTLERIANGGAEELLAVRDEPPPVRRCSFGYGAEFDPPDCEQSKRLRRHISELTNNFCTPQQFQQMYDNLDTITDNDLKLLIRELKRKIEFAERMNWLCLSSRPRGPPHRKTSLPKHTDVKQRFLEVCNQTLSDEVKAALRLPAFDSYEWEDWDVIHLMQTMFVELNLVDKFGIPIETLREWLYEVYKHYNDVPFHNYRHCFCVAQMMYAITWHTNLVQRLGELEVLVLLVSCICHDLDHPGYNNIYQINARTELALRYNDISPLENHHCSIAFRLLEHPECNIFRNMSKEMFKDVREGIIRCILATDMARHNEILTQFQEATPEFDYSNKVHTNLLCMVLIKVADISNEARPMDVAEPWVDRLLLEFFAQSAAEKSEGLPVTPFMDPDKVSKPGSQVRFIGLVLLPLFEALGELLPELTDLIITPVRVALDYYKRLNDAANKTRRSIAEAEASSESGGSPQLPRSQSGISVKSRRSIPSQKSASRTSVDEPILIAAELHDLPEGSESGDSETATEVDVAEKTSKFKVDTESIHRKQSHPNSRKGSREKRPSMIGEYYTTGTRIRGSHGNIQHTNRTYFGSNRAISLDQYSNNRRMSDGVPIQTVHSDNSVLYYHHQRQHRSLDHDTMCSSSDKSTSLNSGSTPAETPMAAQQQQQHSACGGRRSSARDEDCENMNLHVPSSGKRLGKLFGSGASASGNTQSVAVANLKNNNSGNVTGSSGSGSAAGKHLSRMLSFNQQQKLDKLRNNNNSQSKNNNNNNNSNNNNNNSSSSNNNNTIGSNTTKNSGASVNNHVRLPAKDAANVAKTAAASAATATSRSAGSCGLLRRQAAAAGGSGGDIDGTISGSVGVLDGGGAEGKGARVDGSNGATAGTAGAGTKSFMSRLRQLTGRLSFSFDSRESKKVQLVSATTIKHDQAPRTKLAMLEKSRTIDVSGPVAICGGGDGTPVGGSHGVAPVPDSFLMGASVVMNQPKSISPILMQHRHSEVLSGLVAAGGTARNRAYSLDVPIGGRGNCCRSLSGSTTGGGAGSSCGGSHRSLTFSLNNKSLTEDNADGASLALVSSDGHKSAAAPVRNGTDTSLLLLVDDPSSSSMGGGSKLALAGVGSSGGPGAPGSSDGI
ncbi:uncharacterized protein LOC128270019 [Anopheles cruzii]|uniref:uncharacterized protein LOC128270019 n=1 Tax=Anopheles cruzii TaxID=68878 RepID=UPI0022EC7160|nr:uncharacterized protein LOC128270019 [Anopheles cruzii]